MRGSFRHGSALVLACLAGVALTIVFKNFASATLRVGHRVQTSRDTAITGTFRMDTDNPSAVWPLHIVVNAVLVFDGMPTGAPIVADGAPSGQFVLRNAFGPRLLRCGYDLASGSKWWASQVLLDGIDITNVPTDFSAHEDGRLEIVFTQHPSQIRGVVRGAAGLPVSTPWILVAAADQEFRQPWSNMSHVVQGNARGKFSIAVVPGRYRVTAVPENTFGSDQQASKHVFDLTVRGMTVQVERREIKDLTVALRIDAQHLAVGQLPTFKAGGSESDALRAAFARVRVHSKELRTALVPESALTYEKFAAIFEGREWTNFVLLPPGSR